MSFSIINDIKSVTHIPMNESNIEIDNHKFLIIIKLKNQENHHIQPRYLLIQKLLGNHFKVLNCQRVNESMKSVITQNITDIKK